MIKIFHVGDGGRGSCEIMCLIMDKEAMFFVVTISRTCHMVLAAPSYTPPTWPQVTLSPLS